MNRHYIAVPGAGRHELPPLLVRTIPEDASREELVERATEIVETEDMVEGIESEITVHRKLDLAIHLADQYLGLLCHWAWGDSVIEWIRQCEITFESSGALRHLLSPDVWPHAARSSFVDLLLDKHVPTRGVALDRAGGHAADFPAATPHRLLLKSVPVLPERPPRRDGVRDLGSDVARFVGASATRSLPFRSPQSGPKLICREQDRPPRPAGS